MKRLLIGRNNIIEPIPIELEKKESHTNNSSNNQYILNQKRPKKYIELLEKLDAGTQTHDKSFLDSIIQQIREEYPEICLDNNLIGIVAKCYLGKPFEIHTLDFQGNILKHYKDSEPLPYILEKARSLALNPYYLLVEVYKDNTLRAIRKNGDVISVRVD